MATLQAGRRSIAQVPEIFDIREVTRADLAHLSVKREGNVVQTLRDRHHLIARAIASGMSNMEIASTCGIAYNRISVLKGDPAFADLIAHYRGIITAEWVGQDTVIEYMRTNALKAQAMISDKLDAAEEKGEFLPIRDLVSIAELGLDRTGYGKVNKNLNVNVDFAANLEAARKRSSRARPPTIDAQAVPPLVPQAAPVPSSPDSAPAPSSSFRRL